MEKIILSNKEIYGEIYEEIYELRKTGLSYQGIAKHFHEHGIRINEREIEAVCREVFTEKGEKQPRGRKIPHEKSEKQKKIDERIRELRKNGLTFNSIIAYFQNRGIKIEVKQIRKALKETHKSEETEEGKEYDEDWLKEKIYELREQELSYAKIEKYFLDSGIKIRLDKVKKLCKEIYSEKGKEEPKIKREFPKRLAPVISDDVIRILKEEKKWSDEKIAIYLNRKGINVSKGYIALRTRELYERLGKEKPRAKKFNPATGKTILGEIHELEELEEELRELFKKKEQTNALAEAFKKLDEGRRNNRER